MEFCLGKILEYIFDKYIFVKVRPNWLENKTGHNLELDFFCEELKLAFEYNGQQHYEFMEFFHKTEENFEKQLEHDELKLKLCTKENVKLIIVPYTITLEKMYSYVLSELDDNDIKYTYKSKRFNINEIKMTNPQQDKALNIISEKEGKLISGNYVTRDSDVTIECNKEHTWTTTFGKILSGSWCHTCGMTISDDRKSKISDGMKKFCETEEGKLLKKKSFEKRSETMKLQREELQESITHKICSKCKEDKDVSKFGKKSDAKDGYQSYCKDCVNKAKKISRENNSIHL
jgi:hypothetical protein